MTEPTIEQMPSESATELIKILDYNDNQIRVVDMPDGVWLCGKDVAKILNYVNATDSLRKHVYDHDKSVLYNICKKFGIQTPKNKNISKSIYINIGGLTSLLCKSKLPNKCSFIKWCNQNFDINIKSTLFLSKEQDTIGSIMRAFPTQLQKRQFAIDTYKIDLYFPDVKVAVECDEYGHKDRDIKYEIERQKYIEEQLGCVFIRYNPDAQDFDIFGVIGQIVSAIYE